MTLELKGRSSRWTLSDHISVLNVALDMEEVQDSCNGDISPACFEGTAAMLTGPHSSKPLGGLCLNGQQGNEDLSLTTAKN